MRKNKRGHVNSPQRSQPQLIKRCPRRNDFQPTLSLHLHQTRINAPFIKRPILLHLANPPHSQLKNAITVTPQKNQTQHSLNRAIHPRQPLINHQSPPNPFQKLRTDHIKFFLKIETAQHTFSPKTNITHQLKQR
jgi:hypothetical protein